MTKERVYAEQIVLVTDEGENTAPYFRNAWGEYKEQMQTALSVIIIKVRGSYPPFERGLQESGIEMMGYEFRGDYYALPNVLNLLSAPSKSELADMIMGFELPKRPVGPVVV